MRSQWIRIPNPSIWSINIQILRIFSLEVEFTSWISFLHKCRPGISPRKDLVIPKGFNLYRSITERNDATMRGSNLHPHHIFYKHLNPLDFSLEVEFTAWILFLYKCCVEILLRKGVLILKGFNLYRNITERNDATPMGSNSHPRQMFYKYSNLSDFSLRKFSKQNMS